MLIRDDLQLENEKLRASLLRAESHVDNLKAELRWWRIQGVL